MLEPSGYVPINSVDEFGASANEMVLDKGTSNETVTFNYRLRMWVGENYKVGGEEKYFTMKVNVYGNDGVTVEVKGIELDQKSATLKLSNTLQLNVKTTPASPTDSSITWTSSNPFVATVSDSGLVETKGIGTTAIIATSSNGKSATSTINVTDDCMTSSTEGACTAGTPISYKVNDTTTQNFYILKDNGSTLTLITDKVVVTSTKWNAFGLYSDGPIAATQSLENATSNWTNMPSNIYNEATGIATRARLITKAEAEAVGCREWQSDGSTNNSCPVWLLESGYRHWTSTLNLTQNGYAWLIDLESNGYMYSHAIDYDNTNFGVRAVVTISK